MDVVELDVSELPAPEPLTAILQALKTLGAYQILKVIHHREPFPLYEQLVNMGFCYVCQPVDGHFHIYITHLNQCGHLVSMELP